MTTYWIYQCVRAFSWIWVFFTFCWAFFTLPHWVNRASINHPVRPNLILFLNLYRCIVCVSYPKKSGRWWKKYIHPYFSSKLHKLSMTIFHYRIDGIQSIPNFVSIMDMNLSPQISNIDDNTYNTFSW